MKTKMVRPESVQLSGVIATSIKSIGKGRIVFDFNTATGVSEVFTNDAMIDNFIVNGVSYRSLCTVDSYHVFICDKVIPGKTTYVDENGDIQVHSGIKECYVLTKIVPLSINDIKIVEAKRIAASFNLQGNDLVAFLIGYLK